MSRNKDIKFLHDFTGLPYSVCRKRMKACHWDLAKAIGFDAINELIGKMPEIIDGIAKTFNSFMAGMGTALKSIGENLESIYGTADNI